MSIAMTIRGAWLMMLVRYSEQRLELHYVGPWLCSNSGYFSWYVTIYT